MDFEQIEAEFAAHVAAIANAKPAAAGKVYAGDAA